MKNNKIEKRVEIHAPISRVWNALTDHKQFGEWFRVILENPFVPGEVTRGQLTYPGYEYVKFEVTTQKIEPETYFSYTWHPYAVEKGVDYSDETPTLVEFTLESIDGGTVLTVVESGFDKIPEHRQFDAFRMNEGGWEQQVQNIDRYVTQRCAS